MVMDAPLRGRLSPCFCPFKSCFEVDDRLRLNLLAVRVDRLS